MFIPSPDSGLGTIMEAADGSPIGGRNAPVVLDDVAALTVDVRRWLLPDSHFLPLTYRHSLAPPPGANTSTTALMTLPQTDRYVWVLDCMLWTANSQFYTAGSICLTDVVADLPIAVLAGGNGAPGYIGATLAGTAVYRFGSTLFTADPVRPFLLDLTQLALVASIRTGGGGGAASGSEAVVRYIPARRQGAPTLTP